MKKSINVTINSVVFQIEEDAYAKLDKYLESIKKHYGSNKEGEEISTDIEMSIEEKFSVKISDRKKVITLQDIKEVIKIMGTVDEFSEDAEANNSEGKNDEKKERKTKKKPKMKKLYRNSDDTIIAGVCSGIAFYFNIDPIFIRIAFVLLVFADGFGVLAYLILWITMPKAETSAQKLEMQGRSVNLTEIQEAVREKTKMIQGEEKASINQLKQNKRWYKILNFPIKILENVFCFSKTVLKKIIPGASVFFGIVLVVCAILVILKLSIAAGMMLFNINSSYIISDIPLQEFTYSIYYYLGIFSIYLIAAVPLIFLLILGITMARRKNAFQIFLSSILIVIWMMAAVGAAIAISDLGPRINDRMLEIEKEEQISRDYSFKDFDKIYLNGDIKAEITQGEKFAINISGREQDLDRLDFKIEKGQLQITQRNRRIKDKFCFLCFDKEVKAEIIIPRLNSYIGAYNSEALIGEMDNDVYISIGESAKANFGASGQNIECKLAGVSSRLTLTGNGENLNCEISGRAHLKTEDFKAKNIELKQDAWSKATLEGTTDILKSELQGISKLDAFKMEAKDILIEVIDHAKAEINVSNSLEVYSKDHGEIVYKGMPTEIVKKVFGDGLIEQVEYDRRY